jgi:hypothetical protein
MEALATSTKMAGYDTSHDTNVTTVGTRPVQVVARFGGPGRDRTDDLFHAMEARSQLRHRPTGKTLYEGT